MDSRAYEVLGKVFKRKDQIKILRDHKIQGEQAGPSYTKSGKVP